MVREKVADEVAAELIEYIRMMVKYWHNVKDQSELEKLNGLAFSILSALDGCSDGIPGFIVAPLPHQEDKQYCIEDGSNYYPENHEILEHIKADIGGMLHELFYRANSIK